MSDLITNALKFKKPGRPVEISIDCVSTPQTHTFSIEDNGIAIDDIYQDKIFGIFQRLHPKMTMRAQV